MIQLSPRAVSVHEIVSRIDELIVGGALNMT